MIIDHANKVGIITPPKTGSSSMQTSLANITSIILAPNHYNRRISRHSILMSGGIERARSNYTFYILTRHPYERMLSYYGNWLIRGSNQQINFDHFVKYFVIPCKIDWVLPMSSWYYSFTKQYKDVVLKELPLLKSEEILAQHGIKFKLGHANSTKHGTVEEEYNEDLLYLVKLWSHYDFELFDYKP